MTAPGFPSLAQASLFWLKLGCISFGGPAGQIAIMHRELVVRRGWIAEARFLHALNYCMLLPGPEAQQLATYLGWIMHRTPGALIAGILFVLPGLLVLMVLAWGYVRWGQVSAVAAVLFGIKAAVLALIVAAACRLGKRVLTSTLSRIICGAAFAALALRVASFPVVIGVAALIGGWAGRRARADDSANIAPAANSLAGESAPSGWTRRGLLRIALTAVAVGGLPLALMWLMLGPDHLLVQMALFFTQAALLTFGGAYAVLPYVHDAAVIDYRWVSAPQMMDGLALSETTPGPLILVVSFVGFVAGYSRAIFGADAVLSAGLAGAAVATFFTFLPSFVFIFLGAPIIESTRDNLKVAAPLRAVTAAVVGVIAHLAVVFAYSVLWPRGLAGGLDWAAALLASLAGVALALKPRASLEVLALCAAGGWLLKSAGL